MSPAAARPETAGALNLPPVVGPLGEGRTVEIPPTRPSGSERAAYLATVSCQLWPEPAQVSMSGAVDKLPGDRVQIPRLAEPGDGLAAPVALETVSEFVVLPGLRRPRLLVPVGRPAATAAVRRYGRPTSLKARMGTRALSLMFRSGLGTAVLRDRLLVQVPAGTPTIESYLSEQLGQDIVVSLYLGSARANRKPILQLLTPEGGTFGYAKIGVNQLTKVLVGAERDALVRLYEADMSGLKVPRVIHYGICGN